MAKIQTITAYAYRIRTPVINIDTSEQFPDFYDRSYFEKFIDLIIDTPHSTYRDGLKYFHFFSIEQSADADILQGKFHTTKYGELNEIIDIKTSEVVNTLQPAQGVKNEINFVINRNTGFLLIQNDPFRIITRRFLSEFFKLRESLAIDLVEEYNENNWPKILYKDNTFYLNTIHDEGFYDQLAKIQNIKSVSINTTVQKSDVNSALSHFVKEGNIESEDCLDEITDVTHTFKNTIRGQGIKQVKRFVQNALDLERVESIYAHGRGEGKSLKAEFKVKPQSFPIKTEKNENGVLNQSTIIYKMIRIAKEH